MWRHSPHHTHARCGQISDFSTFITQFLHMTNFSPHTSLVILVTNIRYETRSLSHLALHVQIYGNVSHVTHTVLIAGYPVICNIRKSFSLCYTAVLIYPVQSVGKKAVSLLSLLLVLVKNCNLCTSVTTLVTF